MKKNVLFLTLLICMSLLLSACGQTDTPVSLTTTEINGQEAVIDRENGTFTYGETVYRFVISAEGTSGYSIQVQYPNSESITWHYNNSGSFSTGYATGGLNFDPEAEGYLDAWTICNAINRSSPSQASRERQGNPLVGILLIALGIFNAASPKTSWFLSYGWRFKNAEPSDAALILARVSGVVVLLVGVLFLFV